MRAKYGVFFVDLNFDLYSAAVNAVLYALLCYIGPRYKGIRLHIDQCIVATKNTDDSHEGQCLSTALLLNSIKTFHNVTVSNRSTPKSIFTR